jgi:hypothetical protein
MSHVLKPAFALMLALAIASGACATRSGVPRPSPFPGAPLPPVPEAAPPPAPLEPALLTDVVRTALGFRGVPYRWGGSDPSGFDCSGFVQYVLAQHGTLIPREVVDQFEVGRRVSLRDVQAGDLVFFETVSRGASHVGMALGGGQFVHAPSSRGVVRIERYDAPYWARRFVGARRVTGVGAPDGGGRGLPGDVRLSR